MGYSKHELSTTNMLYALKKLGHITPLPALNGHLSTAATFFRPQGSLPQVEVNGSMRRCSSSYSVSCKGFGVGGTLHMRQISGNKPVDINTHPCIIWVPAFDGVGLL